MTGDLLIGVLWAILALFTVIGVIVSGWLGWETIRRARATRAIDRAIQQRRGLP